MPNYSAENPTGRFSGASLVRTYRYHVTITQKKDPDPDARRLEIVV